MIIKRPLETEKWIGKIEFENTIAFEVDLRVTKKEVSDEIDKLFKVKTKKVRTQIRNNRKIAIVTFGKDVKAEDIATKMKMV